jgi:hypothetical protein
MPHPAFDPSREPDWSRLRELAAEVEKLQDAGCWDRAAFERMWRKGERAVHGHAEFLEALVNEADPGWL